MKTSQGQQQWGWLLGEGEARGIALVCLFAGLIMVVAATLAFFTRSYRRLTELYATAPDQNPEAGAGSEADDDAEPPATVHDRPESERADAAPAGRHPDAPPIVPGVPPESR
jgi:DHA3 family multidrug efflux protein-like MFS transporter